MNSLKILFLGFVMMMAAHSAIAQTSYVMTCRGGGDMQAAAGLRGANPHVFVEIKFKRGTNGAGVSAPKAGECTWIDRAIGPNEPAKILFEDTSTKWTQTVCNAGDCRVFNTSIGVIKLMNWVKNSQAFQVHVFNNGAGQMMVTKIGP